MNPVLILTRNCLELTKRCVESVQKQDIPTHIWIWDNGSTDGTREWLQEWDRDDCVFPMWLTAANEGVSRGWNQGLDWIFDKAKREHCLVLNNDTIIPPWFYSELLFYYEDFITGVAVDQIPATKSPRMPLNPHPDFSAFLIRKWTWQEVGPFDERMRLYASDCDYHIRAHRAGIKMWKANVPYYHERSSTLKKASPEDRHAIEEQANKDREVFRSLYGCLPGEPAYFALFGEGTQNDSQ